MIRDSASIELTELLSIGDVVFNRFEFMFVGFFSKGVRNSSDFFAVFEMSDLSGFFFFKTVDFFEKKESVNLVHRFYFFLVDIFVVVLFLNQQVTNHPFVHLYL